MGWAWLNQRVDPSRRMRGSVLKAPFCAQAQKLTTGSSIASWRMRWRSGPLWRLADGLPKKEASACRCWSTDASASSSGHATAHAPCFSGCKGAGGGGGGVRVRVKVGMRATHLLVHHFLARSPREPDEVGPAEDGLQVVAHPALRVLVGGVAAPPVAVGADARVLEDPLVEDRVARHLGADRGCRDDRVVGIGLGLDLGVGRGWGLALAQDGWNKGSGAGSGWGRRRQTLHWMPGKSSESLSW